MARRVTPTLAVIAVVALLSMGAATWFVLAPSGDGTRREARAALQAEASAQEGRAPELVTQGHATSGGAGPPGALAPAAPPWHTTGRVLTPEDEPIPGAEVSAWWVDGERTELVARGTADAGGHFDLALPLLDTLTITARVAGALELRARAMGYGTRVPPSDELMALGGRLPPGSYLEMLERVDERDGVVARVDAPTDSPVQVTLRLDEGPSLVGRLVDAQGTPVRGKGIRFAAMEPSGRIADLCTDPDGRFAVVLDASVRWMAEARYASRGAHRSGPHAPSPGSHDVGDLALTAHAWIEGRVVDPHGRPWAGIEVSAFQIDASPVRLSGFRSYFPPPCFDGGQWEDGFQQSRAMTDARGRFRLPVGDTPAPWEVSVEEAHAMAERPAAPEDGVWAARQSCAAGTSDLELVLDARRLRVRITDARDRPLGGAWMRASGWRRGAGQASGEPGDGTAAWSLLSRTAEDGVLDIFSPPGARWHLDTRTRGGEVDERWIDMPAEPRESTVVVRLAPAAPPGTLAMGMRGAEGAPLDAFQVEIWTHGGREIQRLRMAPTDALPLSPGRYRVRVQPLAIHPTPGSPTRGPLTHLAVQAEIEVVSGQPTIVDTPAPLAGLLAIGIMAREDGSADPVYLHIVVPAEGGGPPLAATSAVFVPGGPVVLTVISLPPGEVDVAVSTPPEDWMADSRAVLRAGEVCTVFLALREASR